MPNNSVNLTVQDLMQTLQATAVLLAIAQAQVCSLAREREGLEAQVAALGLELAQVKAGQNGATGAELQAILAATKD